jgi:hypothetical protein
LAQFRHWTPISSTTKIQSRAAIELRDRLPARIPTRYHGQRLGPLPVKEVYIYEKLEIPLRQSFLITYVWQGKSTDWVATTRRQEFYLGHEENGAISYSTAQWAGEDPGGEKFAHVYVMVEVASGLDESAILSNQIMMIHLGKQARLAVDQLFREKHPDASITHQALALAPH